MKDLQRRFEVVKACGIFSKWPRLEMLRLARMGFINSYKTDDVIIEQGKRSDYLYLIVQGSCQVSKRADKTEILGRLLAEARLKAEKYDSNYCFHHRLRDQLAPVRKEDMLSRHTGVHATSNLAASTNPDAADSSSYHAPDHTAGGGGSTNRKTIHGSSIQTGEEHVQIPPHLTSAVHITLSEVSRAHVSEEILFLEKKLAHEQAVKAKEEQEFEAALDAALKGASRGLEAPSMLANDCDICELYWPRFFGEICILDPDASINLGTVKAGSACEIFMIHKNQLSTFHIAENLMEVRLLSSNTSHTSHTSFLVSISPL